MWRLHLFSSIIRLYVTDVQLSKIYYQTLINYQYFDFIVMYILKYISSWTEIMSSILNFIVFSFQSFVGLFYFKINDITVFILFSILMAPRPE